MKTVFVFSGAGLSAESGMKTFRDSGGLWEKHSVTDVCSAEGWASNPQLVLDFYAARMADCDKAEPNEAHKSFARLESKYKVVHYTQNVDNLLERAGCSDVYHLHGSLYSRKCERHFSTNMAKGKPRPSCDFREDQTVPVKLGDKCPKCDGQLRPDVVFFSENVNMNKPRLNALKLDLLMDHGVFVCVGTSAKVFPAASLLEDMMPVKRRFFLNLEADSQLKYVMMEGPATEQAKALVDKLLKEVD